VKTLRFLFLGKRGTTGVIRWEYHLWILIGLLLAKAVAGGLESLGRLMAIHGQHVPGYIAAAGPFSNMVFWPTAFLFLYLLAAVISVRIVRVKDVSTPES
jgi:hypothetical protein